MGTSNASLRRWKIAGGVAIAMAGAYFMATGSIIAFALGALLAFFVFVG